MRHAFRILNVFTIGAERFSGNPLCVFEDARGIDDVTMLALARQFNLSETTFVLPSERADARVRIFTPGFEMPFAGHPTLGTASVVAVDRDRVVLEMIAGLVTVTRGSAASSRLTGGSTGSVGAWTLRAAQSPVTRPVEASRDELAEMLGLPSGAVCDEPRWVSTGVEQLVIPIATSDLVRAARPRRDLLERWGYSATPGAAATTPGAAASRQEAMAYLWARDTPEWTVRFFFTLDGSVIEDPATGSACCNLGGWLIAAGQARPITATLRQGDAVGRPSRLGLRVDADAAIHVSGDVIELGRGTVDV